MNDNELRKVFELNVGGQDKNSNRGNHGKYRCGMKVVIWLGKEIARNVMRLGRKMPWSEKCGKRE